MTTSVTVRVSGKYRAYVVRNDDPPVVIEGNYNSGPGEHVFYLPHPAHATFTVSEEAVADGDER
ncbi:hypothetical protein ABID65_006693 [Bradyrhizobium sp. S3.9.2]|uniref:hypothetical protein n=1 Tax=Bradyrhizobium sp. S3.9.2 TaxID=3156432 RepID=UPI0033997EC8